MNTCECDECAKYAEHREQEERKLWEADSHTPSAGSTGSTADCSSVEFDKFFDVIRKNMSQVEKDAELGRYVREHFMAEDHCLFRTSVEHML